MSLPATVADALAALVEGHADRALALAEAAAEAGQSPLLAPALAHHLAGAHARADGAVYVEPAAFEAFIRGGGNVPLYAALAAALARLLDEHSPTAVLDIGCGDGAALAPALAAASHAPTRLDLVEPSEALLAAAVEALRGQLGSGCDTLTWPVGAQDFVTGLPSGPPLHQHWPLAQSTFALHTLPAPERTRVLEALRPRVGALAIAEFDVPDVTHAGPEHVRFLAQTYERGLAEYDDDRDLVAAGFLMPVLTGQLAPGAVRSTYEQPAAGWTQQLAEAGYTHVEVTKLFDYWSSPAVLITARGGAAG